MNIVGHDELKTQLKTLKDNANAYIKCGVKVPNLVMNIKRGNGQSYVAEKYTMFLHDNNLRKFHAIDDMKEYRLDGTMKKTRQVFEDIRCNAVYTNEFEGVVAIDISPLTEYVNESQVDYFVEEIRRVAENATVIIYFDDSLGKQITYIKDRLINEMGNCLEIAVLPYTIEEYAEIIVNNLRERGVDVEWGREMEQLLCKIIDSNHVTTAKQAVCVAEKLVLLADYNNLIPRLDCKMLNKYFGSGLRVI